MNSSAKKLFVTILVPAALLIAPFFIPIYSFNFDVATLLTVVSLLFAILVGFFIATTTTNYLRLQTLIATENGGLISLYSYCRLIHPTGARRVASAIDRFLTTSLDFPFTEYVDRTTDEFDSLIAAVDTVRPMNEDGRTLYQSLHQQKNNFYCTRQEIAFTAQRIVKARHWTIIIALGIMVVVLLYAMRDGNWLSSLITGFLSLATYFVLVLIYEIDGNIFLESLLAYKDAQKVFRAIGVLLYYPETAIKGRVVPEPATPYRIGIRRGEKRTIKVVTKTKRVT